MHQQPQTTCINCKRYFEQGQTLPPEGIHIEYKNYYLPIKDHQPKWILLKTIIAFLNSKGGTIFMGVDDATREVIGVTAELKQQDTFMLDFAQLLQNIKPQIDLRRLQQVKVRFVPVLKDKTFQGKYIIKIIVKQGDPAKVYHFAQTLRFVCEDRKHHDEDFKVLWGFYRSNMGKVDSIKGTQLLRQVYEKAKNPSIVVQTFHPGCNPEPLQVSVRNMNIGFKNLKESGLKQTIINFIDKKFRSLNLASTYLVEQLKQDDTVIIKFKSITDYKQADNCIAEHQKQISSIIEGKDSLLDEGVIDNTHFYKIGQSFNPSLRYLRNRSKSRNKSIDIDEKKNKYKPDLNQNKNTLDISHNTRKNHTNLKTIQQNKKDQSLPTKPKHPHQFVKNLPRQFQQQLDDDDDLIELDQQQAKFLPQQPQQMSPNKKFQPKPEQFPQIDIKKVSPKTKKKDKKNKNQEAIIKVIPPKVNGLNGSIQQSPIKQIIKKEQTQKDNLVYSLQINNIFEKSYPRLIHYLENSLGNKLQKIPHKIQQSPNNQQAFIHFHSLRDIESFVVQMSKNLHHRQVLNGFGEGKSVNLKIRKGQTLQDMQWIDKQPDKQKSNQQAQRKNLVKQKTQQASKKLQDQSPYNHDEHTSLSNHGISPVEKFSQKLKQKQVQVKGFPFVITNLRTDLADIQKTHLTDLLAQIFRHFCNADQKVQIVNAKSFRGVIGLSFSSAQERKHFSDQMQTQIIKYHQFTDFFKQHKAYWGVPSGSIILHRYKAEEKKAFKEYMDNLFTEDSSSPLLESKYMKEDSKFFLRMIFHPNKFAEALERVYENVAKSPIEKYASSKEGIAVLPELNRI